MKVLMVTAGYPPHEKGGTEVHAAQLTRALRARGHEVRVFCRTGRDDAAEFSVHEDDHEGVRVQRVVHRFGTTRRLPDILSVPAIDEVFARVLEEDLPDVVHIHHLTGLSGGLVDVARSRRVGVVMTLHDFWLACPRGQRITPELELCTTLDRDRCVPCLDRLWPHFGVDRPGLDLHDETVRALLDRVDRLITPSRFHREKMLEIGGLDPERVRAIPHGLDHERIPPRGAPRFPPKRIGFIGAVLPSKGVHVLVEAMNKLGNVHLECHVHGEIQSFHGDLDYGERLKSLARDDLQFFFHGAYEQDDLPEILSKLDVIVVPSLWWESFCLTIREAMLAGVPVLASAHGAMHEALAPFELDLLFAPGDAQDLAWKLYALATEEERYGRAADLRAHVRTLDQMAADTEEVYTAVAGRRLRIREERARLESVKCKGTEEPYATVFIPTFNGGDRFVAVLDRVLEQETSFDFEVLCIDSGSSDRTLDAIRARPGVRLLEIPNAEFDHGLTRNRGISEARGRIVALLTQDALPIDRGWLERLVGAFDDPEVAGAYCHQVPLPDCNPWQRDRLQGWTTGEGEPVYKHLARPEDWERLSPWERYHLIAFDDVASCVRKSVMEKVPFAERRFGEDVDWAKRAILAGHTLVMHPGAVVEHSHDSPVLYEFKRVYLDHHNLNDLVGMRTMRGVGDVLRCTLTGTLHLWGAVWRDPRGLGTRLLYLVKTPWYSFTQNLAQFLGPEVRRREARGFWGWIDRRLRGGV